MPGHGYWPTYKGGGPGRYELPGPHPCRSTGQGRVDLLVDPRLDVVGGEGDPDRRTGEVGQALLIEVEQVGGDLVLPVQRGAEHRRVVTVDRDHHPGLDE